MILSEVCILNVNSVSKVFLFFHGLFLIMWRREEEEERNCKEEKQSM